MSPEEQARVEAELRAIAERTGGTLHAYPRPGQPVRRVLLRDLHTDRGTQYEVAALEADGTVRVTGADRGSGVSAVFGPDITSYEWVYVVAPDRVVGLLAALGGAPGDDVLARLAEYYEASPGRLSGLLRGPQVGAEFSNWHR
jgi:hypothetical protein